MGKTLVVCNDCPFPANHGGRLDILQRIKSLVEIGETVDLVVTHKELIEEESITYLKALCDKVIFVERGSAALSLVKSLWHMVPFQLASRSALKYIKLSDSYDNVICESEHVHFILKNKNLSAKRKLLRIHNDEVVYFRGLGKDELSLVKKIYYYYESFLFKCNSEKIKRQYDMLLNISSEEYEKTKSRYNSIWLPPYMPVKYDFNTQKFYKYKNKMIFVGNLFMPNNVSGIIWYLNNVHANLLKLNGGIELTIAGNAKNGISDELEVAIKKHPASAIKLIKSPTDDELLDLYNTHSIFINPMLNGAGVKLKNLDAMRHSFYVVSTTIGVEGTGIINSKNTIVADTPKQFLDALIDACDNDKNVQTVAFNAYQHIKENFDTKSILKKILYRTYQ
ncbi:TPA: glycosyltransferase [Raoultella planticola]|jgi:glycosyltransferase involved in cell wall biosynthesis|uniref:glycosyltransferase n=1 Tax=Raoultella ornithinolytica TaxID=54291 RepID=UPI002945A70B|nr:glycosyltransferase [Raoultella ornithinolytica]